MLCSIVADKAPKKGTLTPEQGFTAGLFHDCGIAVLFQQFPDYCKGFAAPTKVLPNILAEDTMFRTSHCMVGQMLAKEWGLPDFVDATVGCHHWPLTNVPQAGIAAVANLLMSIHIANVKSKINDAVWLQQRDAVMAELGVSEETMDDFESDVWSSFEVLH